MSCKGQETRMAKRLADKGKLWTFQILCIFSSKEKELEKKELSFAI